MDALPDKNNVNSAITITICSTNMNHNKLKDVSHFESSDEQTKLYLLCLSVI